jgi:hypothetical protein
MNERSDARAIEWDCTRILIRFFNEFDAFRYDAMAAMFAPDGVWHRQGKALTGRDSILAALKERSATQTVRHVITNIDITVLGADRAQFQSYVTAYRHDSGVEPDGQPPVIGTPYLLLTVPGSFVRIDDGWYIAQMTMNRTFLFQN